jgi:hypothetical protein
MDFIYSEKIVNSLTGMNDTKKELTKPAPRYGQRRIYTQGRWTYEYVEIPDSFDIWNDALTWDDVEDTYRVVSQQQVAEDREQTKQREKTQINELIEGLRLYHFPA